MTTEKIKTYNIQQKAKNIAETPWLEFPGNGKKVRKLAKITFIRDSKNPKKFLGLHLELQYQKRKSEKYKWPTKTVNLQNVPNNLGLKFKLNTEQTLELLEALQDSYPMGTSGISSGKRTVIRGAEEGEIVVTEKNKVEILRQFSEALTEEDINKWLEANLNSLSSSLALTRVYNERQEALTELESSLSQNKNENYWQDFLGSNQWMFGSSYVNIIDERRIDIHHETDFPFEIEDGFMDIVEIKKPSLHFWAKKRNGEYYLYREKFLIPHHELQGAIAQVSKYILQAEKRVDSQEYIEDHGGVAPLKPKGLIVHGRSNEWDRNEREALRLLNDELHNIQIITFDHLFSRAKRIVKVMETKEESTEEDTDKVDIKDIPF